MKLLIAGAGGHGRVVADAAVAAGFWSEIAFLDDRHATMRTSSIWEVVGRLDNLAQLARPDTAFLAAFADARLRLDILDRAHGMGCQLPVLVHPRATVSERAELAAGTVVLAGATVNIGATLGVGCIVNTGATVDHDCRLAEGVHICPGAHLAGEVSVAARTWFGIGAIARQGISIGSDVTVGAGAVCVCDIRDGVTVVGVPARERAL